jgi:adenosylmethionine-8-amino-7-oxononanoate aminotransferase
VACAAALASLDVFSRERSLEKVPGINRRLSAFLEDVSRLPIAGDARSIGVVGAVEIVEDKAAKRPFTAERRIGREIYRRGLEKGLLLRPLGDVVYFFLPLCATARELDDIFARAWEVIGDVDVIRDR